MINHLILLRGRKIISCNDTPQSNVGKDGMLHDFLNKMDCIWENEFDDAWEYVHRLDYDAERELTLDLDHFFEQYARVFSALIREGKSGHDLQIVCEAAYAESLKCASRAWEHAATAKMKQADNKKQSHDDSKHHNLYFTAASEWRKTKGRGAGTEENKIKGFRKVIQLIDVYLSKEKSN